MIGSGLDKVKQRVRVRLRPVILEGERKIYRHMRWVRDDELGGTESNFFDFNGVLNNLVWPVTIRSHGPHSSSQTRVPVIINAATTLTLYCVEWTQMTFFFFFLSPFVLPLVRLFPRSSYCVLALSCPLLFYWYFPSFLFPRSFQ